MPAYNYQSLDSDIITQLFFPIEFLCTVTNTKKKREIANDFESRRCQLTVKEK